MSNYPPGVSESSPDAPWNNYPTDAELDRQSKLAEGGLIHAKRLSLVLEELGIYFDLSMVIRRLEELT